MKMTFEEKGGKGAKRLLLANFVLFMMLFCYLFRFIYFVVLGVGRSKEGGV